MIKKITAIILCFMLALSLCVYAETTQTNESNAQTPPAENMPAEMPQGGRPGGRGGMGGGMRTPPEGFDPSQMPARPENGAAAPQISDDTQSYNLNENASAPQQNGENPMMPSGGFGNERRGEDENINGAEIFNETENTPAGQGAFSLKEFLKNYQTPVISVVLLALAFVFVIFYKRKTY